jgi:hypothetical protein
MSAEIVPTFSTDDARRLTDEVKADAAALWAKLLALYEGGAHTALGYSSWAAYCAAEFDMGKSHAYRMLDAARVVDAVPQLGNGAESVARELAPVLRTEGPEAATEVWERTVAEYGEPTAAEAREAVARHRGRPSPTPAPMWDSLTPTWIVSLELLARELRGIAKRGLPADVRQRYRAAFDLLDEMHVELRRLVDVEDV